MPKWVRVAATTDCPHGESRELVAEGRIVALYNVEGDYFALDGVCPHQGGPLGKGVLTGCLVTCPWHGWQFDVATGQHQASQSVVHTSFPVRVDGVDVLVDIEPDVGA
ncbi:MAG: Rieske 2Fe-2S domain-containing protein [Pirellulaceae bacterium]|nr:Rieske 2Fe-2S domain-containing protein [Pirellulaceae bacterium]MDP7015948.1 Rieske 2Fe-2S domain-containing protein [Pirellulaceae bacterium]